MPEHAVKGIPLLQARNKWGFHRESLRSVQPPYAGRRSTAALCQDTVQRHLPPEATSGSGERSHIPAPGPQRSWDTAARSLCTRRGLPTPPRARGVQPRLSVCSWDGDSEPEMQFSLLTSPLGAFVPHPSSFCCSAGAGRTGQCSFCRYTSPAEKILLFKDHSPVP